MDRKEYDATATTAVSCYSNLNNYGVDGRVSKIIVPFPSTLQPEVTKVFKSDYKPTFYQIKPRSCSEYTPFKNLGM